ncbi:MAG: hypothetical protein AAFV29_08410 [Myxococcota bacterium]
MPEIDAGPIPTPWVTARTAEATTRLAQSAGGRIIAQSIQAHGGLSAWLSSGTIGFNFDYAPLAKPGRRMFTRSQVDLWRSRAIQKELGNGADAHLGWDGQKAWIVPNAEAFPVRARFWATTPYYFVGMPFVLADPGVHFEQLPDETLKGQTYRVVKASFAPGTGDSPDDYYVVYVPPTTHRVEALRYIVAYPGFFKKGKHSKEKLMRYTDYRQVQGLQFAHVLDTYRWSDKGMGEKVTSIAVSEVRMGQPIEATAFAPPPNAEVTTEL